MQSKILYNKLCNGYLLQFAEHCQIQHPNGYLFGKGSQVRAQLELFYAAVLMVASKCSIIMVTSEALTSQFMFNIAATSSIHDYFNELTASINAANFYFNLENLSVPSEFGRFIFTKVYRSLCHFVILRQYTYYNADQ